MVVLIRWKIEVICMVTVNNVTYEIVGEYRDGFNEEAFLARYSDILSRYDYIVGDWGYGQLRLKGFFDDQNQKASFDTKISTLSEYLYEYCNFGCAYFVLKKVTDSAKSELQARLMNNETRKIIRLQMRHCCFMKVSLEETVQPNDTEKMIDGLHFIIDNNHCHYFHNKKLDFIPDRTGFKEFDVS
jgi:uncharacterized protein YutD